MTPSPAPSAVALKLPCAPRTFARVPRGRGLPRSLGSFRSFGPLRTLGSLRTLRSSLRPSLGQGAEVHRSWARPGLHLLDVPLDLSLHGCIVGHPRDVHVDVIRQLRRAHLLQTRPAHAVREVLGRPVLVVQQVLLPLLDGRQELISANLIRSKHLPKQPKIGHRIVRVELAHQPPPGIQPSVLPSVLDQIERRRAHGRQTHEHSMELLIELRRSRQPVRHLCDLLHRDRLLTERSCPVKDVFGSVELSAEPGHELKRPSWPVGFLTREGTRLANSLRVDQALLPTGLRLRLQEPSVLGHRLLQRLRLLRDLRHHRRQRLTRLLLPLPQTVRHQAKGFEHLLLIHFSL